MPPPTTRRPFLFLGLFVSLAFATPAFAAAWDAVHVFGDSYSDSGAGYADINGPTAVVYLARRLGIPSFREVGLRLNPTLATLPASITLPGADVRLSRWGEFFGDVMANAARHGITNTTDTGAGRAIFDEAPPRAGIPKPTTSTTPAIPRPPCTASSASDCWPRLSRPRQLSGVPGALKPRFWRRPKIYS